MFADLAIYNGQIVSMDQRHSHHEAMAVKHGRIVGMGAWQDITPFIDKQTQVINLEGRTVLPGFIDAHQHMIYFGTNLLNLDCNCTSIQDIVQAVEERAAFLNSDEWILGWGVDEAKLEEGRLPEASDFTHISNPVYLTRFCLHTAIVNERALNLAGINSQTEAPSGGELLRDTQGNITGVLREKAMDLVQQAIPPYTLDQMKQAIALADEKYVEEGITSVHEAGMGFHTGSLEEFQAFQELSHDGQLKVRVYGMVLDTFFSELKAMHLTTGFGNEQIKIGAVKMFADGTLSGRTAAVHEEYLDPAGFRGILMYKDEELEEKVLAAHREGYQISIHAIGDRAVEQVIIAYEKALSSYPRTDHRHRIEHCAICNPDLIARMQKLGIIPVPQPGIYYLAGDVYNRVLKPQVLDGFYALASFMEAGLKPAGSSDCPVVPASPFLGMYAAMTRKTRSGEDIVPEQKLSLYEALQMYTNYGAYASFAEHELGSLEVGKFADFVVLPTGFMDFSAEQVKDTKVEMTVIGGKIQYERVRKHAGNLHYG